MDLNHIYYIYFTFNCSVLSNYFKYGNFLKFFADVEQIILLRNYKLFSNSISIVLIKIIFFDVFLREATTNIFL